MAGTLRNSAAFNAMSPSVTRTVMVPTNPEHTPAQIADIIHNIGIAARVTLGDMALNAADLRNVPAIDIQKFDAISRDRAEARGSQQPA